MWYSGTALHPSSSLHYVHNEMSTLSSTVSLEGVNVLSRTVNKLKTICQLGSILLSMRNWRLTTGFTTLEARVEILPSAI